MGKELPTAPVIEYKSWTPMKTDNAKKQTSGFETKTRTARTVFRTQHTRPTYSKPVVHKTTYSAPAPAPSYSPPAPAPSYSPPTYSSPAPAPSYSPPIVAKTTYQATQRQDNHGGYFDLQAELENLRDAEERLQRREEQLEEQARQRLREAQEILENSSGNGEDNDDDDDDDEYDASSYGYYGS